MYPKEIHDPFAGRFDAVKREIGNVLDKQYSGNIGEAMRIGNAAVIALRILDGTYDVNEVSFKVTTVDESK